MPYENSYYNPDWEAIHDYHNDQRARASQETARLAKAGLFSSSEYRSAKADFNKHHSACCNSFRMQYRTVQEYAEWLFQNFPVDMDARGTCISIPPLDFTELKSVEEADAAWSRVSSMVSEAAGEQRLSLPTGHPEGVRAFADASKLVRYRRQFMRHELFPEGCWGGHPGVHTLVTIDEMDDGWHVCFMWDHKAGGASVTNTIELLATAVRREAHQIAEQDTRANGLLMLFSPTARRDRRQRLAALAPERLTFYEHVPPKPDCHQKEQFERVSMSFEKDRYVRPEWEHFKTVPKAIQSARFDCALDISQMNSRPRLIEHAVAPTDKLPTVVERSRSEVIWRVPLQDSASAFVWVTRTDYGNEDRYVVTVNAEAFYKVWLRSANTHAVARDRLSLDRKFHHAERGFAHGKGSPVPLASVTACFDGGRWHIHFTDGITRTFWLLHHGAMAFPVETRRYCADWFATHVGVGQQPMTVADLLGSESRSYSGDY